MTQVALNQLSKTYSGSADPAVDRLTLEIDSGKLAALLGPSGCGKTTAMKMIAGLLKPTSGDICFDGNSVLRQKPERRGVVMVFQNYLLFPYMSVADNIGFGLKMRRCDKQTIQKRVGQMLERVKLVGFGGRRPSELSGGQQQRVALARALIVEPRVLLLDEPLSNLDSHLRTEMRELIRSLQSELRITTLFVTHDQEEAISLADSVGLILDGRLKQYAQPDEFFKKPIDRETARFFGGVNFINGRIEGDSFISSLGKFQLAQKFPSTSGVLTIRPENIVLNSLDAPANENTIEAIVVDKIYLGTNTRIKIRIQNMELEISATPANVESINPGQTVNVTLPASALWFIST